MQEPYARQILPGVNDFKKFWKESGPFKYALTSNDFPPVLLAQEEWIFGNDINLLLKELMQFNQKKMAFVHAPFNPGNKNILRPVKLIPWKINHFPEEWNMAACDLFVPEGHLTCLVLDEAEIVRGLDGQTGPVKVHTLEGLVDKQHVEKAFFNLLEKELEKMGYILLKPYLTEWEKDEKEAGLL